ncbi:MAG: uroporphyrinogen-III synthase, partial [Flavobacteriales bacterium]
LAQKERLLNAGIAVVSYDAIKIEFTNFTVDPGYQNLIFTSQNAVTAFLQNNAKKKNFNITAFRCFCVGEKTAALLEENGLKVIKTANYGAEVAKIIINSHTNESFLF